VIRQPGNHSQFSSQRNSHPPTRPSSNTASPPPECDLVKVGNVASTRAYRGLPDLSYPLHDRDIVVTAFGRICMHRKKIHISTVLAGQMLGIKEVDDGSWLVSFMDYDLGYIELEQRTLQPLDKDVEGFRAQRRLRC
jgi:hypothetical protein